MLTTDSPGDGADTFDSSPFNYDVTGINEYLSGTGKRGGPLVTSANETFRSDLRIFSSDNNTAIRAMSTQPVFEQTCLTVFQKMLDTVPDGVALSDVIGPRAWITQESHLDLSPGGVVQYSGKITSYVRGGGAPPNKANYFYGTEYGGNAGYLSTTKWSKSYLHAWVTPSDAQFRCCEQHRQHLIQRQYVRHLRCHQGVRV